MTVRIVGVVAVLLLHHISVFRSDTCAEETGSREFTIQGTVTGPGGEPVVDALVAEGVTWGSAMRVAKTDNDGRYLLEGCPAGPSALTIVSKELAPDLRKIKVAANMEPQDFQLKAGRMLRVRVVDRDQTPIPEAHVIIPWWRDCCTLRNAGKTGLPLKTDNQGRWVWTSAPDEAIELYIISARHACLLTGKITPTKGEHVFTLAPPLQISGQVLDATTRKPIQRFGMTLRSVAPSGRDPSGDHSVQIGDRDEGRFSIREGGACHAGSRVLLINADGYKPAVSKPIKEDAGDVSLSFLLEPMPDSKDKDDVQTDLAVCGGGRMRRLCICG